jgi:hypothetical protein
MLSRLHRFFIVDEVARWRAASWTFLFIFVYGIVFGVIGKRPDGEVGHEAALAGTVIFVVWLIAYCRNEALERVSLPEIGKKRLVAAAFAAALLVLVAVFPIGRPIQTAVISHKLQEVLTQSSNGKALAEAKTVIKQAQASRIRVDAELVSAVGKHAMEIAEKDPRLQAVAWQTVSEAVTYLSEEQAPEKVRVLLTQQLPNCFQQLPEFPAEHPRLLGPFRYERCVMVLDEQLHPAAEAFFEMLLNPGGKNTDLGRLIGKVPIICANCVVKYRGAEIPSVFGDLIFENCIFIFSLDDRPSHQFGKRLAKAILESPSSNVRITSTTQRGA